MTITQEQAAADYTFYADLVTHRVLARHRPHEQCEMCPPLPLHVQRALANVWSGVVADPERVDGQPCLAGTRIQVRDIANLVWQRGTQTAINHWQLDRDDVILACWYMAKWGGFNRWREWADTNRVPLWGRPFDQVTDPPTRAERRGAGPTTAAT